MPVASCFIVRVKEISAVRGVSGSRWQLFSRRARTNAEIAACSVLGNALAYGRVKLAILFWACVVALTCTLLQTITMTEKPPGPRPRAE